MGTILVTLEDKSPPLLKSLSHFSPVGLLRGGIGQIASSFNHPPRMPIYLHVPCPSDRPCHWPMPGCLLRSAAFPGNLPL
jgi:hypothetical protein